MWKCASRQGGIANWLQSGDTVRVCAALNGLDTEWTSTRTTVGHLIRTSSSEERRKQRTECEIQNADRDWRKTNTHEGKRKTNWKVDKRLNINHKVNWHKKQPIEDKEDEAVENKLASAGRGHRNRPGTRPPRATKAELGKRVNAQANTELLQLRQPLKKRRTKQRGQCQ